MNGADGFCELLSQEGTTEGLPTGDGDVHDRVITPAQAPATNVQTSVVRRRCNWLRQTGEDVCVD